MTLERLDNRRWGFDSNCFVCEDRNEAGLRVPFFHDTDRDEVVASLQLDGRFSGAPNYLHGGVALAVLDEAMAWAAIAIAGCFAVTAETSARFHRPVRVDVAYEVRARVVDQDSDLHCEAEIIDEKGRPRVTATAVFTPLGPAEVLDAVGTEPVGTDSRYVRGANRSRPRPESA